MKHYHLPVDYMEVALLTRTVEEIEDAVTEFETDDKIRTNMIGKVAWSLKHWIGETDKLHENNGRLNLTYDEDRRLTSVSATVKEKINPNGAIAECRLCTRMWVRPDLRNQQLIARYHALPGLVYAAEQKIPFAWMSFNTDREALLRRIDMLKHHRDPVVARVWRDWTVQPGLRDVNYVPQFVLYTLVRPEWGTVKLHPLPDTLFD